ncbi:MAG: NAD(P)H-dependent oxidoreductase [Pseudomonadota bacterium]
MKVLAFAATNSSQSINRQLVIAATDLYKSELVPSAEIELLDLNHYEMPIYSIDRQNDGGIPDAAHRFFDKIGAADAMIISYAEHNGFYTAAFKNLFDWASRIDMRVFQDKPMIIMATSIGPNGGANVLKAAETSAPFFGADIRGTYSLPKFNESFDQSAMFPVDPERQAELRRTLSALVPEMA